VAKWRELRETGLETAKRTTLRFIQNPGNQKMLIGLFIGGGLFGMSAFLKESVRFFPRCQIASGVYNTSSLENIIRQCLIADFNQRDVITEISQDLQENRLRNMTLEDIIRFVILNDLYRVSLQKGGKLMRIFSFKMKGLYLDINSTNSTLNSRHHQELDALGLGALWGPTTSVQFYAIPEEEMKLLRYAHSEFLTIDDPHTGYPYRINIEDFHLAFLNYITGISVFANDRDLNNIIRELKDIYLLNINTSKYNFYRFMGNYQCFGITDDAGYYIKLDAGNINNIVDLPYYSAKKRLFIDTNILISLLKYDLQTKLLALNSRGGLLRNDPIFSENQYSQSDEDVAIFMQNLNTGTHNVDFLITDMIFEEFITTSSGILTKILTDNNDNAKPNKYNRLSAADVNLIQSYVQKLTSLRQSFAPILSHGMDLITWKVL
jgi:hypothetical protein